MITLEVENYCHNCNKFEPVTHRGASLQVSSLFEVENIVAGDIAVRCAYRESCRAIEQMIRSEIAAKEGEE